MNQSRTWMNRNPQRIRALSHPVSSFDWIVSRCFPRSFELDENLAEGWRAPPLPPEQPLFIFRGGGCFILGFFIIILIWGSLGHVLPYFPSYFPASSILTRTVTLVTGLNVE